MKTMRALIFACLSLWVAVPAAAASIIVDTFQAPGDQFADEGVIVPNDFQRAYSFVAPKDALVTAVDLALRIPSSGGSVVISLAADDGGLPDTQELINGSSGGLASQPAGVVRVSFSGSVAITAGSTYWLGVGRSARQALTWQSAIGAEVVSAPLQSIGFSAGLPWQPNMARRGAFRILGVPEPSLGMLLVGSSIALATSRSVRRRVGVGVTPSS